MDAAYPLRILPTLPMLAESLMQAGWNCEMVLSDEHQSYRGIRLYHRKQELQKDVLYLLRPTETEFPFNDYSYLSSVPHPGQANHLICPEHADEEILDQMLEVFSQFRSWEESIDLLVYRNAGLQELCELGGQLLENPVCIHDDWFVMMAMTAEFSRLMEPEYWMTSTKGFIPRAVVEDFRNDSEYLETYSYHDAQIWVHTENRKSLYVNLWDGLVYKGRLLVAEKNRAFLHRDFLIAEVLTQRAVLLLRRKQLGDDSIHQNMDDIVFSLLQGKQADPSDLNHLLNMLHWQKDDRFVCIRTKSQHDSTTMAEHMIHSDLFRCFPGSYILLRGQEQCVLLNLSRIQGDLRQIRYQLAPLCRDYCLYAGISFPVSGIREVNAAYYQAGAALEQAFRLRCEKWILTFPECAMDHIVRTLPSPLMPSHLIAPELTKLMDWDREKGTQYFETFRAFLLHERDIPRTAEALIIHRTTLLYRLQKIQSLIHANLEDPWQRLYLILSLWLVEREWKK